MFDLSNSMKHYLQIFINQRFWKQIDTTVDSNGNYDLKPAFDAVNDPQTKTEFVAFAIRNPQELTSIEIRPVTIRDTERLKK
jgi:hypothetical protein